MFLGAVYSLHIDVRFHHPSSSRVCVALPFKTFRNNALVLPCGRGPLSLTFIIIRSSTSFHKPFGLWRCAPHRNLAAYAVTSKEFETHICSFTSFLHFGMKMTRSSNCSGWIVLCHRPLDLTKQLHCCVSWENSSLEHDEFSVKRSNSRYSEDSVNHLILSFHEVTDRGY